MCFLSFVIFLNLRQHPFLINFSSGNSNMECTEKSSKTKSMKCRGGAVSKIVLTKHHPFNNAKVYYNGNFHHTYEIYNIVTLT